ncbi:MAG TPA: glutathione S-transferase N-terminal domain-containing protein [Steroidobacteraceae bacterium]|jgi:stringent starvation protein A
MMTLYSRADDARCHRVRIVLAEKGLDVRIVETDPARPPEDLIDLNPYQTVPTLVDRDLVVYEPGIISEYLDERFPHPSLASTDPAARAQTRVALRRIEQDWYAVADTLEPGVGCDRRERDRARKMLAESILASEPLFRLRPWFLSDQFSQLDAAVAPILWRLPRWEIDLGALGAAAPSIERYAAKVFARPSFARSLSEAEKGMRKKVSSV